MDCPRHAASCLLVLLRVRSEIFVSLERLPKELLVFRRYVHSLGQPLLDEGRGQGIERLLRLPPPPAFRFPRQLRPFLLLHDGHQSPGKRHNRRDPSGHNHGHRDRCAIPPCKLAEAVPRRRRTRQHRLITQLPQYISRERTCRLIPAVAVLLLVLHHNPVQLAAEEPAQLLRIALPLCR